MNPTGFDINEEIATMTRLRDETIGELSDPDIVRNRPMLVSALDRVAEWTGKVRALKMIERVPVEQRRDEATRLLCETAQKPPQRGNEGVMLAAERSMYAVLVERIFV